ncbi:MAG: hypothetical protein ACREHG_03795 [Candidatus Saccharimonadales bacterium]
MTYYSPKPQNEILTDIANSLCNVTNELRIQRAILAESVARLDTLVYETDAYTTNGTESVLTLDLAPQTSQTEVITSMISSVLYKEPKAFPALGISNSYIELGAVTLYGPLQGTSFQAILENQQIILNAGDKRKATVVLSAPIAGVTFSLTLMGYVIPATIGGVLH